MRGGKHCFVGLIALALAAPGGAAIAQAYPSKPVRFVVGFTPDGGTDINARLLAAKLPEFLGQAFVVENRPGAGSNLGSEYVAKSPPDGYTMLVCTSAVAINMALYKKLGYDTLRDFAPVSLFSEAPNILVVNNGVAARTVGELVELARAKPGVLNYSSAGSGTSQHMSAELFKLRTKTNIVHVPYKGTAPSLTAVIAGDVDMTFANIPAIIQHVKAGRVRPLASSGDQRPELMPDVPTMKEAGLTGAAVGVWYGVLAPAGTPREVVDTMADAIRKAARSPDMKQRLAEQGADPVGSTPEEFGRVLREDVARWIEVVGAAGIRAD
ncbi:MAG TPA: tripartite tricarboxylate transporter substrate binding protein [Burkholderiales bacterium]|nr:tripartite tricarboxylate transporter substrate binding protein [Burkholderiales bacterium]